MEEHWMCPSLSRYVALLWLVVYPNIPAHLKEPRPDQASKVILPVFKELLNLDGKVGSKIARDLIGQIHNFIAPRPMSRISTTSTIARAMQHTASTHNSHYSSEIFEINEDGAIIRPPMIIARDIHAALGECQFPLQSQRLDHVELGRSDFDSAARRCYQNPTASVTNLQFLLLQHICGKETRSGQKWGVHFVTDVPRNVSHQKIQNDCHISTQFSS